MTLIVGKTQIHLGWPVAGSILVFVVVITWGAATVFFEFRNDSKDIHRDIGDIKKSMLAISGRVDTAASAHISMRSDIGNLKNDVQAIKDYVGFRRVTGFVTERRSNGHIIERPYKN